MSKKLMVQETGKWKKKEKAELLEKGESRNLKLWEEINEKKKRK